MKEKELPDHLIDDFILGHLSDSERQSFAQKLELNPELAQQIKIRRKAISGLEAYGRKALKEELKIIQLEFDNESLEPIAKKRRLFPYVIAAASILLLIFAASWFFTKNSAKTADQLYASYFKAYDITTEQRSNNINDLSKIYQLYQDKKYKELIPLLDIQLKQMNPQPSDLLLMAGIAHLESNQAQKAITNLKKITSNGDFNYEDEVSWYSALAYLQMGNIPACKKQLQSLKANPNADHHVEASKLFNTINNM